MGATWEVATGVLSVFGLIDGFEMMRPTLVLAEMDRDATVARLAAGKRQWKGIKRTDGRWPYGEHPRMEYAGERAIVERMRAMRAEGLSLYRIAKVLTGEGIRTRYGAEFKVQQVGSILAREKEGLTA